jgi:hypothetical protein
VSTWAPLGGEECLHDRCHAFCVRGELEVAAVIDDKLAARCQPVHDPRDDGVARRPLRAAAAGVDWPPIESWKSMVRPSASRLVEHCLGGSPRCQMT